MLSTTPVTQRDVAQACGVHPSTICLALKNSPSIPEETRRRVRLAAEELGYQPNAAARNLAYLRTEKKGGGGLPIAWINQEPRRDHWRTDPEARVCFNAARTRAEELGYHLEEIWTQEAGMTAARVVQIARARGIEGVLFPVHRAFDFSLLTPAWGEFATVGLNDHRLGEWIDLVCPDYYQNTETMLRQLRRMGCSRVGLVLTPQFDAETNGLVHSCFLRNQNGVSGPERVPVCFVEGSQAERTGAFFEWFGDHRPDAVICRDPAVVAAMAAAAVPALCVQWRAPTADCVAGLDECAAEVAAAAVDCVVAKSRRYEKGLGGSTRMHLIRGLWHERCATACVAETIVA